MLRTLKTIRPVVTVQTMRDVREIERRPYKEVVTAKNLYDLFLAAAEAVGDSMAMTVLRSENPADIEVAYTHTGFLKKITQAANMFHALGMTPSDGVAAFLTPTFAEMPALLFGAQVAGKASTINYLLSQDTIFEILNAQAATILIIPSKHLDETCWQNAQGVFDKVPTMERVLVIGDETEHRPGFIALSETLDGIRSNKLAFEPTEDNNAVCMFYHTGGTTGRPKLVQLTHANIIHAAFGFAQIFGYDETAVVINGGPFFHVGGTMAGGLGVLGAGGHMIVPSPYALRPKPIIAAYWKIVETFGVTFVGGVPTSIGAITNSFSHEHDISTVRTAFTGGAVLPKALETRFTEKTGIPLLQTYGMTETAGAIAFQPGCGTARSGSVGIRAPFSETRIVRLDKTPAVECALGQAGRVQVRGPQVFPGYLEAEQNAGALDDEGWLNTGDIGYLTDDGFLWLTGREKDIIVRGGHNIDPAAIEDVANKFPGVVTSAAVGMPDQYAGELPVLFVVADASVSTNPEKLSRYIQDTIHERPARPRTILFLDELPLTAVGKIFKPKLVELAIAEKVRQEAIAIYGAVVLTRVDVGQDDQKNTLVNVVIATKSEEIRADLQEALDLLPQKYIVRCEMP